MRFLYKGFQVDGILIQQNLSGTFSCEKIGRHEAGRGALQNLPEASARGTTGPKYFVKGTTLVRSVKPPVRAKLYGTASARRAQGPPAAGRFCVPLRTKDAIPQQIGRSDGGRTKTQTKTPTSETKPAKILRDVPEIEARSHFSPDRHRRNDEKPEIYSTPYAKRIHSLKCFANLNQIWH